MHLSAPKYLFCQIANPLDPLFWRDCGLRAVIFVGLLATLLLSVPLSFLLIAFRCGHGGTHFSFYFFSLCSKSFFFALLYSFSVRIPCS
jgi:hypothetical protein